MSNPTPGKGALIAGAVLLVLGVIATALGIAVFGGTATETANTTISSSAATPAEITGNLAAATTYAVYEKTGSTTTITPADVVVTESEGIELAVSSPASDAVTTDEAGATYTEVATFDIGTSGTYTVKVAKEGATVAVAPSLSVESQGFAWGAAPIIGIGLGVIGIILLIVGAVQRSRA